MPYWPQTASKMYVEISLDTNKIRQFSKSSVAFCGGVTYKIRTYSESYQNFEEMDYLTDWCGLWSVLGYLDCTSDCMDFIGNIPVLQSPLSGKNRSVLTNNILRKKTRVYFPERII